MKRIILLGILALALVQLGCATTESDPDGVTPDGGDPDGGDPDGGDPDGGDPDGGDPDGGDPDGGDPDGGDPDGGTSDCNYVSEDTGVGWGGPPSCSATTAVIGAPLSCTSNIIGADEAGVNLVDPETFFSGGGGFTDVASDGPVTIDIDTQFAEPGEYIVIFDGVSEVGGDFAVTVFGFDESQTDYVAVDQDGGTQGNLRSLNGCLLLRVTLTQ